jgi:hypothetical protein
VQLCRDGACLWIASLAGLRGATWRSGDCVGLCRSEEHSLAEIVNVCGLLAWQALGVWAQLSRDHGTYGALPWLG